MSSRETGELRELRTSAERMQSPRTKLAPRQIRTPRTSNTELYRKPKQGRESDDDVRRKQRQQPTLWRLQVLPKMETGQAIPGHEKRQASKEAQEQRHGRARPRIGDASQSESARKRRHVGPLRPTYIQRADLLEKDHESDWIHDQLVGEVLMRLTPRQCETRCSHNMVHFVLCEQQRLNPFWSQPATLALLGKGPKFIPRARSL